MKRRRLVIAVLGLLGLLAVAVGIHQQGPAALHWLPACAFHRVTGLHCPGCGMTRAADATLHGNFTAAFRFNPVGMILFPLALIWLALETIGWIREKPLPFNLRPGGRGAWVIVGIVMGFWILRNISNWPFTLLAPR